MAIGPLLGLGFGGYTLYDIMYLSGLLGGTGSTDKAGQAGWQAMQAATYPNVQASDELVNQRYFAQDLSNMENLAKATNYSNQEFQRNMSEDLASLLGGKTHESIARASMAPPDIQSMMMNFASARGM